MDWSAAGAAGGTLGKLCAAFYRKMYLSNDVVGCVVAEAGIRVECTLNSNKCIDGSTHCFRRTSAAPDN